MHIHAQRVVQRTALLHHKESRLHSKTGIKIILDVHFPFILSLHSVTEPSEKAKKITRFFTALTAESRRRLLPELK